MSFDAYEISASNGQPVELFLLSLGNDTFYMTSADEDYTYGGTVYTATEISRGAFQQGSDQADKSLTVSLPSDHAFPARYAELVPGNRATLSIYRIHRNDSAQERTLYFKGVVQSIGFSNDLQQADLSVSPLATGLSRNIPRYTYQASCNHVLFDTHCKMISSLFRLDDTVAAITDTTVTMTGADAKADGYFDGGYLETEDGDTRLILSHVGNTLTLIVPLSSEYVGQDVKLFAGCDHSLATCKTKFNNVVNFGGCAFVPTSNVFIKGIK